MSLYTLILLFPMLYATAVMALCTRRSDWLHDVIMAGCILAAVAGASCIAVVVVYLAIG